MKIKTITLCSLLFVENDGMHKKYKNVWLSCLKKMSKKSKICDWKWRKLDKQKDIQNRKQTNVWGRSQYILTKRTSNNHINHALFYYLCVWYCGYISDNHHVLHVILAQYNSPFCLRSSATTPLTNPTTCLTLAFEYTHRNRWIEISFMKEEEYAWGKTLWGGKEKNENQLRIGSSCKFCHLFIGSWESIQQENQTSDKRWRWREV